MSWRVTSAGLPLCLHPCRYATRAMSIQNAVVQNNTQTPEEEVAYLKDLVLHLQEENNSLRAKLISNGISAD